MTLKAFSKSQITKATLFGGFIATIAITPIGLSANPDSELARNSDLPIDVIVGEVPIRQSAIEGYIPNTQTLVNELNASWNSTLIRNESAPVRTDRRRSSS